MVGTSARLLRLLSLLQARRSWTGAELTSRLDVTPRTLRRDVDRLRSLGYPVASTAGVGGGYRFGAGTDLPPLLLDDQEALAVALGLRAAAAGAIAGLEDATLGALAKLDQVMPARLRRRVSALHGAIVPLPHRGPAVDVATLALLAGACRDAERLRFEYRGRDAEATRRRVEPAGLVSAGFRWYLVAWDLDRADWRTFRVDRIAGKPARGETFTPRPPPAGRVVRLRREVGVGRRLRRPRAGPPARAAGRPDAEALDQRGDAREHRPRHLRADHRRAFAGGAGRLDGDAGRRLRDPRIRPERPRHSTRWRDASAAQRVLDLTGDVTDVSSAQPPRLSVGIAPISATLNR